MIRKMIFEKVRATLMEALNVDEEEVRLDSKLQEDLGAEEIDYLDIAFQLRREFGIKISYQELFPESIDQTVEGIINHLEQTLI